MLRRPWQYQRWIVYKLLPHLMSLLLYESFVRDADLPPNNEPDQASQCPLPVLDIRAVALQADQGAPSVQLLVRSDIIVSIGYSRSPPWHLIYTTRDCSLVVIARNINIVADRALPHPSSCIFHAVENTTEDLFPHIDSVGEVVRLVGELV